MVRRLVTVALLLAASAASAGEPPLTTARGHLDAGRYDDLFLQLEDHSWPDEERLPAAALLAEASGRCLEKGDAVLALHFAQLALRTSKGHPRALEAAARTCRRQQEFSAAERYADQWLAAEPASGAAKLLRAEVALDQGEWQRSLDFVKAVPETALTGAERERLATLRRTSREELEQFAQGVTVLKGLAARMRDGAGTVGGRVPSGGPVATAVARTGDVVVYGTAWCGYCTKVKAYLRRKGVAFVDKDIETDSSAADELASKARRAGVAVSGVPVIDVKGQLVLGFNEAKLDSLLR